MTLILASFFVGRRKGRYSYYMSNANPSDIGVAFAKEKMTNTRVSRIHTTQASRRFLATRASTSHGGSKYECDTGTIKRLRRTTNA
jgi:hypothetical protein